MSNFIQQQPIILASGSFARRQLLQSLGLVFEVIPSDCDEQAIKASLSDNNFSSLALELARQKALIVSKQYPDAYVIAADQLCIIDKQILDKPINHQTAIQHLQLLQGKTHQQLAAICLAHNNELCWSTYQIAELTMRELDISTIENYLKLEQPYQSCGAYNFERHAKWLFTQVTGSDCTILGLPLMPLIQTLLMLNIVRFR